MKTTPVVFFSTSTHWCMTTIAVDAAHRLLGAWRTQRSHRSAPLPATSIRRISRRPFHRTVPLRPLRSCRIRGRCLRDPEELLRHGRNPLHLRLGRTQWNHEGCEWDCTPTDPAQLATFSQAAEENGQSRAYLGIHWASDKDQGITQGRQVADYVFSHAFVPTQSN
jgi:hypothetical protein